MKSLKFASIVALTALGLFATACGPAAQISPPDGFARMDGSYDYRAASAHGVVIGARSEANEPRANLEFWADTIDLKLQQQGLSPEGKKDVKSKTGLVGKELRYNTPQGRYWVTVFATERRIVLVEATGQERDFDPVALQVEAAMLSVRLN